MIDAAHVMRLVAYHHWADDQLFDAVAELSLDDLDRPWGGSFHTGRGLLEHVLGAERLWSDRLNGAARVARPEYPRTHDGGDLRAEWHRIRDDQSRYVRTLTDAAMARTLTYQNLRGETKSYHIVDVMLHVVNHGTYHRGQMSHLLRDRGRSAPSTDFLLFVDRERVP